MNRRIMAFIIMLSLVLPAACVRQMGDGFMSGTDTVAIKTVPDGVMVYKNGEFQCNAPCDLPLEYWGTSGEKYTVSLVKDGFKSMSFEMNRSMLYDKFWSGNYISGSRFGAGNTFVFTYTLERQPGVAEVSPAPVPKQPVQTPMTFTQSYEKRIALVIGNSNYRNTPLPNPVNDARDVSAALQMLGFEIMLVTNADLRGMEQAIDRFSRKANGAVALFFFAGHGLQVNGENYLVPIGAHMDDEGDVRYEAVSAGRVLDNLRYADASLNIIILDACRSNPFARSFRAVPRGLAALYAPRGSIVAFSTAPGDVAADGTGRNSPYAAAFLRHVADRIPVEAFFKEVAKDVAVDTGDVQRPWLSTDFLGDFSFSH